MDVVLGVGAVKATTSSSPSPAEAKTSSSGSGSWSGWFFVLFILMFAIYMKIAVDTFCKGELTDFECLKFFTVDVVKGQISVFDPFKKLLRT